MLHFVAAAQAALTVLLTRLSRAVRTGPPPRSFGDRGQATAEYALVLLGAAAVALLVLAWAGQTDSIGRLFDTIVDSVISQVS